jgi:hypothetical protein
VAGDVFGRGVAVSGDLALVGAPGDDIANPDQGSGYLFARKNGIWIEQAKLTASDGANGDQFGWSVALAGDTALVGAILDNTGGNNDQGAAYIFPDLARRQLVPSIGSADNQFGVSVALSGDTALVGANMPTGGQIGRAFVFVRSAGLWSQQQQLTAGDPGGNDNFGFSVALSGDTALVGVPFDNVGSNADQGSAYVFVRSGTTWTQQGPPLLAGDGAAGDNFGWSVALSGDTAVVGAPSDTVGSNAGQGSA